MHHATVRIWIDFRQEQLAYSLFETILHPWTGLLLLYAYAASQWLAQLRLMGRRSRHRPSCTGCRCTDEPNLESDVSLVTIVCGRQVHVQCITRGAYIKIKYLMAYSNTMMYRYH